MLLLVDIWNVDVPGKNIQEPANLTVLVAYVPISSLLGASFLQSGSWNTNL